MVGLGWQKMADAARWDSDRRNGPICRNHDSECWQPDIDLSCDDGRNRYTARTVGQQEANQMKSVDRPIDAEQVAVWMMQVVLVSCPTSGWHDYLEEHEPNLAKPEHHQTA